jgi:hypothetical protein
MDGRCGRYVVDNDGAPRYTLFTQISVVFEMKSSGQLGRAIAEWVWQLRREGMRMVPDSMDIGAIPNLLLSQTTVRTVQRKEGMEDIRDSSGTHGEETREPFVHINYAAGKAAVKKFVQTWKLNTKQARAFTAIANHSLGYGVNGDRQITMGISGDPFFRACDLIGFRGYPELQQFF